MAVLNNPLVRDIRSNFKMYLMTIPGNNISPNPSKLHDKPGVFEKGGIKNLIGTSNLVATAAITDSPKY